jgi:CRP/FNR family transcriptional regulator, cyclic AMP receptor protein
MHRSTASFDPNVLIDTLPRSLQSLARRGTTRGYRKGTVILEEGMHGDALYLVLHGRAKIYSADARGREVVHTVCAAGDYFGEMSLDGGPRSASVMALEPLTCTMVTRQSLREHLGASPDFALELITRVIARARKATAQARSIALRDVYGRVVELLDSHAATHDDGTRTLTEPLTHADIAARVGCSREMVSRLLKDLERGGYIEPKRGAMRILRKLPERW